MAQRLAIALVVVLAMSGCGKGPVDPSENVNEPRSGTVQPLGVSVPTPPFTISNLGEFTVTMTALSPGNVFVGIGWGQWNGSCGLIAGQTNVVSSANIGRTVLSGQIFLKGDYCVAVFDASSTFGAPPLTVAQNYTIQVSHP